MSFFFCHASFQVKSMTANQLQISSSEVYTKVIVSNDSLFLFVHNNYDSNVA
jgi:hypothetical protein